MKYLIGVVVVAFLLMGGWYAVSQNETSETASTDTPQSEVKTLSVVTSFYPLQFALERIVGEVGTVVNVGAGKDPHDFEPTTQDVLSMQKANVVVLQGAEFEHWGDDVTARLQADGVPVIRATTNIELQKGDEHHEHHEEESADHEAAPEAEGHEHGIYDPHTWLDPVLFSEMVDYIASELATIDPAHAATYQVNASGLRNDLAALDTEYKNRLSNCALGEVITTHEALGYVARRYGFEVHSIAGLSTEDTPSATTLAALKEEAKEGIGAILLEENSVAAYGETLARETGLQTLTLNPIEYVVPSGQDYLTLMRSNLDTFATALKCNG